MYGIGEPKCICVRHWGELVYMRTALERGIVYASGMLKERERRLNRLPQGSGSRGPMDDEMDT
ncbi:hypothetical protein BFC18_09755 [Alteromonas confluentis]|uniref:Uncharacterized protein n=1 Tax=Alteromonas confluentis TaxID=1656094 RepID=A0A1E7ZCC6_9ALTE|nr:hypothetical protein BFC18_09755 [Alteromonas confluentis]